jgi:hypothetical protein
MIYTPPGNNVNSHIFTIINDGKKTAMPGFKHVTSLKSCSNNFHSRTSKLTVRLNKENSFFEVFYDTPELLHYTCLGISVPQLIPPFKIAIATANESYEDIPYLDAIEIEKFTLFNRDENLKTNHSQIHERKVKNTILLNGLSKLEYNKKKDLIEYYPDFNDKIKSLEGFKYTRDLNTILDNTILFLTDIKENFIDEDSTRNKNFEDVISTYSTYIAQIKEKTEIIKNIVKTSTLVSQSINNGESMTYISENFNFEYFLQEIRILKNEWENIKTTSSYNDKLNTMLTENIKNLTKLLSETKTQFAYFEETMVNTYLNIDEYFL